MSTRCKQVSPPTTWLDDLGTGMVRLSVNRCRCARVPACLSARLPTGVPACVSACLPARLPARLLADLPGCLLASLPGISFLFAEPCTPACKSICRPPPRFFPSARRAGLGFLPLRRVLLSNATTDHRSERSSLLTPHALFLHCHVSEAFLPSAQIGHAR